MFSRYHFWLCIFVLTIAARGHQPFESSTTARLQHGRLEVVLTLSGDMAAMLVQTGDVESEPGGSFESYRARLQQLAPGLLKVDAGGAALQAQRVTVRLNENAEPEVVYLFPPPPPGTLRFDAVYLRRLPRSYFGRLSLLDQDERSLGQGLLVPERAVAEITPHTAPGASDAPAVPSVAPAPVAPPVRGRVGLEFTLLAVAAATSVAGALWLLRRWVG